MRRTFRWCPGIDASIAFENVGYKEFVVCLDGHATIEEIVASEISGARAGTPALE
jgi:hypothetical protein